MEALEQKENFIDYISHRPGVEKDGEHGLWDAHGKVQNLAQAVREVAEHTGLSKNELYAAALER